MNERSMEQKLERALTHSLNIHGFSFQYAVLKEAKVCFDERKSPWVFEVSEFPVAVKETPTHIDFILKNSSEPFYIVAECKRANPALSNWCFVKAPYVSRSISTGERVVREVVSVISNHYCPVKDRITTTGYRSPLFPLGFDILKTLDGSGSSRKGQC